MDAITSPEEVVISLRCSVTVTDADSRGHVRGGN